MQATTNQPPVDRLYADSIDVQPIYFDWPSVDIGHTWDAWEAVECESCRAIIAGDVPWGDEPHGSDCPNGDGGWLPSAEGPMMDNAYPVSLPVSHEEAARILAGAGDDDAPGLPLCVANIGGGDYLALTGGGMNLTWEIADAYIRLGQLPPAHFCNLPAMAGRGNDERDRYIIAACMRTLEIISERAQEDRARLVSRFGEGR